MINELEDLRQKNRTLQSELKQLRAQVAQKNVSYDSNSE
jgi:cell division septum initiation protein DivIVA|tara:strand:+ start:518 stop:634 length:117 start_codon:yes stop_codon:yes gene_type:complete